MENLFQKQKENDKFMYESGKNIFFTSDTHFNHANIIKFCNRPFSTISEMDEKLIRRWNDVVGEDDIVFHLGDFAWGGSQVWSGILERLNGHKHLIIGNHDVKNLRAGYEKYFESMVFQKQIVIEGQLIYLNHYPFLCYSGVYSDRMTWQLFGHVHSTHDPSHMHDGKDDPRLAYLYPSQYDVGVDNNDFRPVSFYEVRSIIEKQINDSRQ